MNEINLNKASIFLSLILRHKPEVIGIELNHQGYANVSELLEGMKKDGQYPIDIDMLKEIVANDKKGRYSFNSDYTMIRANQGHSVKVDVGLKEIKPPTILFHGTADKNLESILKKGLDKRSRLYVHLSDNITTALEVGKRHGDPVVLVIDSKKMYKLGYKFYLSENNVWLTEKIPSEFISYTVYY